MKNKNSNENLVNDKLSDKNKLWWHEGVKFECQGSGKCCVSHGEYGSVWLTPKDQKALAKKLKITVAVFQKKYCEEIEGIFRLKEKLATLKSKDKLKTVGNCIFLKEKSCSIYEARPTQCRTWPFWPEVMSAKTWNKEVKSFCPGVGKGKLWTKKEIQKNLEVQAKSEVDLVAD